MEELRRYNELSMYKEKEAEELVDLEEHYLSEFDKLKIIKETKKDVCEGIKYCEKQIYLIESLQNKSICWPPEMRTYLEVGNIFVLQDRRSVQYHLQSKLNEVILEMEPLQDTLHIIEIRLNEYDSLLRLELLKIFLKKRMIKSLDEDLNDLHERLMKKRSKKRRE